jgi:L-lysine 6-transaminase
MTPPTEHRSQALIDELRRYVVFEPYPFVLDLEHCSGMWLATVDGRRIFDWCGFYASKLIAMNHPRLYEPAYLRRLSVAANNKIANPDFPTTDTIAYYKLLHELAPRCMRNEPLEVYAVNSGAEAVENLLKYMINLHQQKLLRRGNPSQARRFLYFDEAFHGRTVFALNVTQISMDPVLTKGFHGFAPGNIQIPFPAIDTGRSGADNDGVTARTLEMIDNVLSREGGDIIGIIVEPIQGAGGHRMAQPAFFRGLSTLAAKYEVSLGFDEVQTAGGQTGTVFAIDQFDLPHPPQAVAVAKKFGNGVVYMRRPMEDRGVLDSTWGGSQTEMVRFVQEWRIVTEEKLLEAVPEKTAALVSGLEGLVARYSGVIGNVRGMGLYQGFSCASAALKSALIDHALKSKDLLLLGAGRDSIRFRPNLNVTLEEIALLIDKLDRSLAAISGKTK